MSSNLKNQISSFYKSSSKSARTFLILSVGLLVNSAALAQDVTGSPSDFKEVKCWEHNRPTFITYYSAEDRWCAMDNQTDCIANRGRATSVACRYSRSRARDFVARLDAIKARFENASPTNQESVVTADTAPEPSPDQTPEDDQRLQNELLGIETRLNSLNTRKSELEKRESELRQRLNSINGGF